LIHLVGWSILPTDKCGIFAPAIEDTHHLVVPVICIYEVFKIVLQMHGLTQAELRAADLM
jgi:hypothetical protein